MAVYFFHGQEEFLLEAEIKKLKNTLIDSAFASMAYKVFYNPDPVELMTCLQTPPLMFGNSLNIIHIDKYLTGKKSGIDDKQIDGINAALSVLPDSVNIVFVCKIPRDENKKPDSRVKLFKTISKYAQVREFAQIPTYKPELNAQITKMAKDIDVNISSDAVKLIIEQLGSNLTKINSELEKLKVAAYPEKTIDKKAVLTYCSSVEDVFALADLIVKNDKNNVMKQLDLLTEKCHPLEIFGVVQAAFQKFIYIKTYEKTLGLKEISLKLRLPEFIVKKISDGLKNTGLEQLIEFRKRFIKSEFEIKTGAAIDPEITLEAALLQ